jgi:hypothetical protein
MIMTRNKAQKTAARQRMARTGEPYSVARKATQARAASPAGHETPEEQAAGHETPEERLAGHETPEEQYLREAGEAGVPAAELDALRAVFLAVGRAGQLRQAAGQARERADQAEEAEVRAGEAEGWAGEARDLLAEESEDAEEDGHWHDTWPATAYFPPPRLPRPPHPAPLSRPAPPPHPAPLSRPAPPRFP